MKDNIANLRKQDDIRKVAAVMAVVKEVRTRCDFSAVDFAFECGVTNKAYTMLEREGRGTAVTLYRVLLKIAEWGIPTDEVLKGKCEPGRWDAAIRAAYEYRQRTKLTKAEKIEINRQRYMIQ